jgi:hypothetical protein
MVSDMPTRGLWAEAHPGRVAQKSRTTLLSGRQYCLPSLSPTDLGPTRKFTKVVSFRAVSDHRCEITGEEFRIVLLSR